MREHLIVISVLLLTATCAAPAAPTVAAATSGGTIAKAAGMAALTVSSAAVVGTGYLLLDMDQTLPEINTGHQCFPPFEACLERWSSAPGQRGQQAQIFCFGCYDVCVKNGAWPGVLPVAFGGNLFNGQFSCSGE